MSTLTETRYDPATAEDFLSIVLSDDELVRAEFEAIVAEQWPDEPPGRGDGEEREEPSAGRAPLGAGAARPSSSARCRNEPIDRWWRQRSPPLERRPRPAFAGHT